jgi:hypothetical protein
VSNHLDNHLNHLDNHLNHLDQDRARRTLENVITLARAPGTQGESEAACMAVGRLVLKNPWITAATIVNTSQPRAGRNGLAAACAGFPEMLTEWERAFLVNVRRFPRLSPKQVEILQRIANKLRSCGCPL